MDDTDVRDGHEPVLQGVTHQQARYPYMQDIAPLTLFLVGAQNLQLFPSPLREALLYQIC